MAGEIYPYKSIFTPLYSFKTYQKQKITKIGRKKPFVVNKNNKMVTSPSCHLWATLCSEPKGGHGSRCIQISLTVQIRRPTLQFFILAARVWLWQGAVNEVRASLWRPWCPCGDLGSSFSVAGRAFLSEKPHWPSNYCLNPSHEQQNKGEQKFIK